MRSAVIIGGGIAGPVAAMALQRAGVEAEVYEGRAGRTDEAGAFLGLAPNGMNVLRTLGIDRRVESYGFMSPGMAFANARGKRIGTIDVDILVIKRGLLHRALREEAASRGIRMHFGKRLERIDLAPSAFVAHFADGTSAHGDFLLGCDGLHSRTRQVILPDGPAPSYTGMVDCGGFAQLPPSGSAVQHMTYGHNAFFGHMQHPSGEVYWFSNVAWPEEPSRSELEAVSGDRWHRRLLSLHADDPASILQILQATPGAIGKWPLYDMPPLPTWHRGPICLVGDAAHAISPHIGQGASLALEDAAVVARCVRDIPDLEQAFATYQRLRRDRVERLVAAARRQGDRKIPGRMVGLVRDLMLPVFLKAGARASRWVYSYEVDWDRKVA